ncbi:hypothetical protein BGZ80_011679 [Entomortierella chlamydospora]|uniref:Arm-like repeat domain-containing protein n=1 Tax=Entomortierella chlamydospora TaxID=101097 RepID=A0A9P6T3P6_9FUNG|nr:hypothetical protein BGZ79_005261 [Entomortierella chlamydospora]KAG0022603.1 hypothetical protein BGZ80_011679 [Entomortierella chlamydospora]
MPQDTQDLGIVDVERISRKIFDQNVAPSVVRYTLPDIGGRLTSTSQLAYCLSLLNPSWVSHRELDEIESDWSQSRINDPDERQRLLAIPTDLIKAFVRDELKKPDVVAEVVSLAAVLDQDDFRKLLQVLVNGIDQSLLLEVHMLEGLAQLLQNAPYGCLDADDLVKILELLSGRLKDTHQQSTQRTYQLVSAISRVLDSMVDSQVEGLSREQIQQPLAEYLNGLKESPDAYLVYQSAYAYQALMYIPDDETILQINLRRTRDVIRGVSGVVSAVKAMDVMGFIDGLQNIQLSLASAKDTFALVSDAYDNVKALAESGQGFLESLKEGLSFTRKSSWYPALRGLDALIKVGRFPEVEELVRNAPCKHHPAFQWGLCQRLGEIAVNTTCDVKVRASSVAFLGELYNDDATWGQQPNVKLWILSIIARLSDSSYSTASEQARMLLQEFGVKVSAEKRPLYQTYEKDRSRPYPMVTILSSQRSPLLDRVQDKPDVETPLRQLKRERLKGRGGDVYIYPRAKASARAKEDFDLTSKVQEFLGSTRKVFLTLGDSGSGKSTFNRAVEISMWDKYGKDEKRIPLFIHLPSIDAPEYDMITKQLRRLNFTENQILELKLHHEFVVICDGYDESQQTRNLYNSNSLNQPGCWKAQMMITCRTEYISADYKDCFQPTDRNGNGLSDLFQEATIMPFNKNQIRDYVDQYILLKSPSWESKDYLKAFKEVPNLQDLIENPFLLKLALEVLPNVLSTNSRFSAARVTRAGLYDEFVAQWLERGKIRLMEIELSPREKDLFKDLSELGFKECGVTYMKELVAAIYDNQKGAPVVSYSERRDRGSWKEPLFSKEDGKHLLREAIPLGRDDDQYRFIHKSVLEYGLSLAVFDPREHSENTEPSPVTSRRGSTSSALSFEIQETGETTAIAIDQSLLDSPFGRINLVAERSVTQFLIDRVQQLPVFKNQLYAVIERSKTEKTVRIAAANAITVLIRAGVQFNGADLRGIQIPGADLSYGVFDSAHLEGADLRKTNLQNIWLHQADLSGAQMKGVQFGELPFIPEDENINCCEFSPSGDLYAVGTRGGDISLYETSTWNRIRLLKGDSEDEPSSLIWTGSNIGKGVNHLAFSAKGDYIVSGIEDGKVQLWEVNTGECIHTLQGHEQAVSGVAFSPKGDRIVSGSNDSTIVLWDANTGNCIHTLKDHSGRVTGVVYSPKGDHFASASFDKTVLLWDVDTGNCIHALHGHTQRISDIAFSPNGDKIASASIDSTVRLWDVTTGDCVLIFQADDTGVGSIAYSPNGSRIATSNCHYSDGKLQLWDVDTGECIHTFEGHDGNITCFAYSPNGDQIASGSGDNTVRLWDVDTGECIQIIQGHSYWIVSVLFPPKGGPLTTAGSNYDRTIRQWDIGASGGLNISRGHSGSVTALAYSPKGGQVTSGSEDNSVRLWDLNTGECIHILHGHIQSIRVVLYSPTEVQVASGAWDSTIRLWDVATGDCIHTLEGHTNAVTSLAYSPKGDWLLSGSNDTTARLWDIETGDCIRIFEADSSYVASVAYSPKGGQVATACDQFKSLLWNVDTGECVHTLETFRAGVEAVAYSPKGDQLASGGGNYAVQVWDTNTGKCIHTLEEHNGGVTVLIYSPKGDQIASGGWDFTVRLWDVGTGECVHVLNHDDSVNGIVYSPKGDQIASVSKDKTARLWDVATGQCLLTINAFDGSVNSVVWDHTSSGEYLVTGSSDKSVRRWQIMEEGGEYKALMSWSSSHGILSVSKAFIGGVQGLGDSNSKLLLQRGAIDIRETNCD